MMINFLNLYAFNCLMLKHQHADVCEDRTVFQTVALTLPEQGYPPSAVVCKYLM